MSRSPRKKLGLPLDADDMALVNKTAKEGGLLPSEDTAPSTEAPTKVKPDPESALKAPRQPAAPKKAKEAPRLRTQDLRCNIGVKSQLAAALQSELDQLDAKTRAFVSPATVLRQFIEDNDELLAKLFQENNSLK
jgi:hypothetical protein